MKEDVGMSKPKKHAKLGCDNIHTNVQTYRYRQTQTHNISMNLCIYYIYILYIP